MNKIKKHGLLFFICAFIVLFLVLIRGLSSYADVRRQISRRQISQNDSPQKEEKGKLNILSVSPGSAAYKAGLRKNDVILRMDGQVFSDVRSFANYIRSAKKGQHYIVIKRDKSIQRISVNLPSRRAIPRLGIKIASLVSTDTAKDVEKTRSGNIELSKAIQKNSYFPKNNIDSTFGGINVLKYIFVEPDTHKVILVGTYDPAYPSGPIAYSELLSDLMNNPYPKFSLESVGDSPAVSKIKNVMDSELKRISNNVDYGKKWMIRMGMAILNSSDSLPEKQVFLMRMKKEMGIEPEEFNEYLHFNPHAAFISGQTYNNMENFIGKLLKKVGVEEKYGRGFIIFSRMQKEFRQGGISEWTQQRLYTTLGVEDELFAIRDAMNANRISVETAARRMFALYYSTLLKGFGAPAQKVDALAKRYAQGYGYDEKLAEMLEQRYEFLTKKALQKYVFQSFVFSQDFLRKVYKNLPLVKVGVRLYGQDASSHLSRAMFNADYALKYITSLSPEVLSVEGHQFSSEYFIREAERQGVSLPDEGLIRYWIKPGFVEMNILDDNGSVMFGKASVSICSEPMGLSADSEFLRKASKSYAQKIMDNFDEYARIYPALHVMRETAKLIAFMRQDTEDFAISLDEDYHPVDRPVPSKVEGFVTVAYVSKERGDTDSLFLNIDGGVSFADEEDGDLWIKEEHSPEAIKEVSQQLNSSVLLAEQAADMAIDGDFESARDMAEKSAQAMTGSLDISTLPKLKAPLPSPDKKQPSITQVPVGAQAAVAVESIKAVEKNVQAIKEAKQNINDSQIYQQSMPERYQEIVTQNNHLKQRSQKNLNKLKQQLIYYRKEPEHYQEVLFNVTQLDPYKPSQKVFVDSKIYKNALPNRETLIRELKELEGELELVKINLKRLTRESQRRVKLFDEWEQEVKETVNRAKKRGYDFARNLLGENFFKLIKWRFQGKTSRIKEIEKFEDLINTKDFAEWANADKYEWDDIGKGIVSAVEALPVFGKEAKDVVKSTQNIIDSTYDISAWLGNWENINALDKTSESYLKAVKKSSVRMEKIITRINEIKSELSRQ